MRAAWYEHQGSARDSLVVGEMEDPAPGEGEVRIALLVSGISPGDTKKRSGWQGSPMAYPRIVPHSDGAGRIDAVGRGVGSERLGEWVWCYGAQSYRPLGTAAEYVVVPEDLAIAFPELEWDRAGGARREILEQGACLGIAGITAHRAVFADGPVRGLVVLVHGAVGGVGSIVTQLARGDGATVVAVVRDAAQQGVAKSLGATRAYVSDDPDLAAGIRELAPEGVHRIAEVDFATHADLDAEVLAVGGVICSYSSSEDRVAIPYWALGFKDATVRLLGSDDFPAPVKAEAARALTDGLVAGGLRSTMAARFPLSNIVGAHEMVEHGAAGRVVIDITDAT